MVTQVILKRGKGKKKLFNGKHAMAFARRAGRNVGGWVTVVIRPIFACSNEPTIRLNWRNKAWLSSLSNLTGEQELTHHHHEEGRKSADCSNLCDLADELLVYILGFLGGDKRSSDCNSYQPHSLLACELNIQDAEKLHATLSLLSKKFHRMCSERLVDIMGSLRVFFPHGQRQVLKYLHWLARNHLKLESFSFYGHEFDTGLVSKVLMNCDTRDMHKLCLRLKRYGCTDSIRQAWYDNTDHFVDLHSPDGHHQNPSLNEMAEDLNMPFFFKDGIPNTDEALLHKTILLECPSLTSLDINMSIDRPTWLVSPLSQLEHLTDFCIMMDDDFWHAARRRDCAKTMVIDLRPLIRQMPRLHCFCLRSNTMPPVIFELSSNAVREINVEGLAKHNWVQCNCPALETFSCKGHYYGNGARPLAINGQLESDIHGDFSTETTHFPSLCVSPTCKVSLSYT